MIDRIRWKLFWWLLPIPRGVGSCANRSWRSGMWGPYEVTVTFRDTRRADGYERTELLGMLRTVREHEARQGWKVPEPT